MRPPSHRALLLASVIGLTSACRDPAPGPAALAAEAPAPAIELSGCAAVLAGRVCEVTPAERAVRVWIEGSADRIEVRFGGARVPFDQRSVQGGSRLSFTLPEEAARAPGEIAIERTRSASAATARIAVVPAQIDPKIDAAKALRREGRFDEAARAAPDPSAVPEAQRGRAIGLAARIALSQGQAERAAAGLLEAMRANAALGRASDAAADGCAAAFTLLTRLRRIPDARAALDEAGRLGAGWDDARAQVAFFRGLLAAATGDVGRGSASFEAAARAAERLGLDALRIDAVEMSALLLAEHGRHEEAAKQLAVAARDFPADAPVCRRAALHVNLAWVPLLAQHAGAAPALDPAARKHLAEALTIYETTCPSPAEAQNVHVNLALGSIAAGTLDEAERHAARARAIEGAPRPEVTLWLLDVEARLALARGDARRALTVYESLAARARATAAPHVLWRAEVGRGRALEAMRRDRDAEAAYRAAEGLLSEASLLVPLAEGRAAFLGDRAESARRLADLLVRTGRPAGALAALRTSRARALAAAERPARLHALPPADRSRYEAAVSRYLAARAELDHLAADDWKLSAEKLDAAAAARGEEARRARDALDEALGALAATRLASAPDPIAPGELLVLLEDRGPSRRAIAADASGTRVVDLPATDARSSGERLWDALSDEIDRCDRVVLSVDGAAAALDLHASPWRGEPLALARPVAYSVGAGAARRPAIGPARSGEEGAEGSARARRQALVVADPGDDLLRARDEARAVERALAEAWTVTPLVGPATTSAAVAEAAQGADLLHFAGHGRFDAASTWDSRLALGGTDYLSVGDIVLLPGAPRFVVLSACESGRTAAVRDAADMSLAAAFVAAGTQAVIAVSRPVRDDLAAAVSSALYLGAAAPDWDPVRALPGALRAVAATAEADWTAYRAWVR